MSFKISEIENKEIRDLSKKIFDKMLEYEKDKDQAEWTVWDASHINDEPIKTLNKLYDYLCDSYTIKTRNAINEFLLEMDTEFQERCKKLELMEKTDKIKF